MPSFRAYRDRKPDEEIELANAWGIPTVAPRERNDAVPDLPRFTSHRPVQRPAAPPMMTRSRCASHLNRIGREISATETPMRRTQAQMADFLLCLAMCRATA
jgi:hypothetical protein